MHFSWKTSGTMIEHWQKQRNSCLTLTIGPPATAFAPRFLQSIKKELLVSIRLWLDSDRLYTVRYAMGMLMRYYLDNAFRPEYLAWVAGVHSEEYYFNMMRAWFFATALAKQPEETLPWLTEQRLDAWTHNKTIQKAVESYRITPEMKQQLRRLRIPITVGNR